MIELYGMESPNVLKVAIMLEEIARPYRFIYVDVGRGRNFRPEFLAMNPVGKVPVLVDNDDPSPDQALFESGAILIYLAERYGSSFLAAGGAERWETIKWLMVQMAYVGPMLGQLNHFQLVSSETRSYGGTRYRDIARKIYRDLDTRLGEVEWLAGDSYSIADIATYPWIAYLARHGFDPADHRNLIAWRDRLDARPQIQNAVNAIAHAVAQNADLGAPPTGEDIDRLFSRFEPGPPADFAGYAALGPLTSVQPKAENPC